MGEPGLFALRRRIEDQREAIAEKVQEKSGQHLDVATRVPDADLAMRGGTEAQPRKVAEAESRDAIRSIGSAPCRAPALGDQRRNRAVNRRAPRIAPVQIGNDDLERVEGFVIKLPAHSVSPNPIVSG